MLWTPRFSLWQFQPSDTYGSCLGRIYDDLANQDYDGLCILAISSETQYSWEAYPASDKIFHTVDGSGGLAKNVIRSIMEWLIADLWGHTHPEPCTMLETLLHKGRSIDMVRDFKLPSQRLGTQQSFCHDSPFLFDLLSSPLVFSMAWLRKPPAYHNDYRVYVERPLRDRPQFDWIRLLFFETRNGTRLDAVLVGSSSSILQQIARNRPGRAIRWVDEPLMNQVLGFFCVLFKCMNGDLLDSAQVAAVYIEKLVRMRVA